MEGPGFEYLILCIFISQCQKLGSLWPTGIFELQKNYQPKSFVEILVSPFCLSSFHGLEDTVSNNRLENIPDNRAWAIKSWKGSVHLMPETKNWDVSKSKLENRLFIIEGEPQLKLGFKDYCSLDCAKMLWLNYLGRYLERTTKKINY